MAKQENLSRRERIANARVREKALKVGKYSIAIGSVLGVGFGLYSELNYPSGSLEAIKIPMSNIDLNVLQPPIFGFIGALSGKVIGFIGTYLKEGYSLEEASVEMYNTRYRLSRRKK